MDKKVWTEELIQVQIEILSLINCWDVFDIKIRTDSKDKDLCPVSLNI